MRDKKILESLLGEIGIRINGNNPYDIQIHNQRFYKRVLTQGSLGLGESYMDGWWECEKLDELFYKILYSGIENKVKNNPLFLFEIFLSRIFNMQSKRRAFRIGERHYNLGNELFKNMLDKRMVYSCGYWKDAYTLDQAQEAKLT